MSKRKRLIGTVPAALATATVAMVCAWSANAQTLQFTQSAGFYSGSSASGGVTPATVLKGTGGPPQAGFGGLEFWIESPNTPFAPPITATVQTWKALSWGCLPQVNTNCANGGVQTTPWATSNLGFNPDQAGRSSLEVLGLTGTIDTVGWTPVTKVIHHNHVIGGESNTLSTVDIASFLRLGPPPGFAVDGPAGSVTGVVFTETPNLAQPCASPGGVLGPNPIGGAANPCDDFAFVSGLDLSPLFIPAGAVGNPTPLQVNFRMTSPGLLPGQPGGALVCGAPIGQAPNPDPLCNGYAGPPMVIYTAENGNNEFQIEAQLSPVITTALFVIGDCEWDQWKPNSSAPGDENDLREVGDSVYFWGAQWWRNNCMSSFTDNGYPAMKGYATNVAIIGVNGNCGTWEARPGNSGHPPATIPNPVRIIVTDNVIKDGPNISGNIKQIVTVATDPGYGPNPGHAGTGTITSIECTVAQP